MTGDDFQSLFNLPLYAKFYIYTIFELLVILLKILGALVICIPRFTGSREICELWKDVSHKSKFTEKLSEPGSHYLVSHNLGSHNITYFI